MQRLGNIPEFRNQQVLYLAADLVGQLDGTGKLSRVTIDFYEGYVDLQITTLRENCHSTAAYRLFPGWEEDATTIVVPKE
jgi:hypothetical protein